MSKNIVEPERPRMGPSPWEANRFSASQEVPRILWNQEVVQYRVDKCLSLSWLRSLQSMPPSHFMNIYLNIVLPSSLGFSSGLFPSGSPTKTVYAPLFSSIHATWLAHLILLDLIARIIFGEDYRSLSFLLCSFLHTSVTFCVWGSNILLNTLFSNVLSLRSSINQRDQVSNSYETTIKL